MAVELLDGEAQREVRDSDLDGVDGGDPETVYVYRQIPPSINRSIAKKHTETPINRRTGHRETNVNSVELMDDLLDYALVGWKGIKHRGADAACTREFKLLLDPPRKLALVLLAGMNQVAPEGRDDSFRSPATVL